MRRAKDVLANRVRSLGIAPNAQLTFDLFPQLRRAAEGLAWHLTDRVLVPLPRPFVSKTPLLDCCLASAFSWMLFHNEQNPEAPARELQTAFLAGLLYHVPDIIHVTIHVDGQRWDPFHDAPLGEWLPLNPGAEMRDTEDASLVAWSDQEIRMSILTRVLPDGSVGSLDAKIAHVLLPPDNFQPPRE